MLLGSSPVTPQTGYKYRDAEGRWVFSDQPPAAGTAEDTFNVRHDDRAMTVSVAREDQAEWTALVGVNDCDCMATVDALIVRSAFGAMPAGTTYRDKLTPHSRSTLARAPRIEPAGVLEFQWKAALGAPDAKHSPSQPYRVPFALGSTFPISQAYPSAVTHNTTDSRYAVDIAMPDGTPVYEARAGTVIQSRHDSFRGALAPVMLDQANLVAILHDDGTIALYAHLHWDSIRVRIGAHVARGEYIANSGNTGYTSGPHLHFAVIRNAGWEDVSVPVQFAGLGGSAVTPVTNQALTAY